VQRGFGRKEASGSTWVRTLKIALYFFDEANGSGVIGLRYCVLGNELGAGSGLTATRCGNPGIGIREKKLSNPNGRLAGGSTGATGALMSTGLLTSLLGLMPPNVEMDL